MSSAYLLISHGSRDPRPQQAMDKLAALVRTCLGTGKTRVGEWENPKAGEPAVTTVGRVGEHNTSSTLSPGLSTNLQPLTPSAPHAFSPSRLQPLTPSLPDYVSLRYHPLVGTATLELADAPLHEQICQFANVALAEGCNRVQLLPVFLLPGVHVREDIPTEVALAQQRLGEVVVLQPRPHLGVHLGLGQLLASQWATVEADAKILLAHGTRRRGGNESVEVMAKQLGTVVAYWSVSPTLEEQIKGLAAAGYKRIGILPYFLFSGGITDAIAQKLDSLQAKFPTVQLSLGEPIGASAKLANLIVDLIEQ